MTFFQHSDVCSSPLSCGTFASHPIGLVLTFNRNRARSKSIHPYLIFMRRMTRSFLSLYNCWPGAASSLQSHQSSQDHEAEGSQSDRKGSRHIYLCGLFPGPELGAADGISAEQQGPLATAGQGRKQEAANSSFLPQGCLLVQNNKYHARRRLLG